MLECIFKVNLIYVLQTGYTFFSPVLYSRFSLIIYFINSGIYLSVPIYITLPSLGVHTFVLYISVSISWIFKCIFIRLDVCVCVFFHSFSIVFCRAKVLISQKFILTMYSFLSKILFGYTCFTMLQ